MGPWRLKEFCDRVLLLEEKKMTVLLRSGVRQVGSITSSPVGGKNSFVASVL